MSDLHAHVDPRADSENPPSEDLVGCAFLTPRELLLFRHLIHSRRSLPVYRAGWCNCYECLFESTDLAVMARHILRDHRAVPVSDDEWDVDNGGLARSAGRRGGHPDGCPGSR